MEPAFAIGDQVSKVGGDYRYDGEVCGIVIKKSGKPRYVVEDDRGVLFIFNSGQIKRTRINTMSCPKCNGNYILDSRGQFAYIKPVI